MQQKEKIDFKKMHRKSRDDYLLINSLVGYGYSPIEPWMIDAVKYYEGNEYYNSVPSILHQEDKKSKPSATKKATTKTIAINTEYQNQSEPNSR